MHKGKGLNLVGRLVESDFKAGDFDSEMLMKIWFGNFMKDRVISTDLFWEFWVREVVLKVWIMIFLAEKKF